VAEGNLNQKKHSLQIENYWKMPVWPLEKKDIETINLYCETGALCKYIGIDITDNKFSENNLFKRKHSSKEYAISADRRRIDFFHKKDEAPTDSWQIQTDKGGITVNKINFQKILLDLLFEMEFANTFEDKNFFQLQKVLQNNRTLDALTWKFSYINELTQLNIEYEQKNNTHDLPHTFKSAEKQWLNVCFLEDYKEVFESRNSIFKSSEEEAELVLFKTQIAGSRRPRSKLFVKKDAHLRNLAASFFLRKYSIFNAFRTLLSPIFILSVPILFLLIPLGDFCLSKMPWGVAKNCVGVSSIGIPVFILLALIIHYFKTDINLFKLLLPRMFLGIMLGWSSLWGGEDFWKSAVTANAPKILMTDTILFVLIFLYVFTDIRNKLFKAKNRIVIGRAMVLVLFAILISFVQGFYVLQFQAEPMLENSGFLNNPKMCSPEDLERIEGEKKDINKISMMLNCEKQKVRKIWGIENFSAPETFMGGNLYYIWCILFSQLLMSILIGIVLQLLWEDRPITEPL
jgi:hypothetical protein